MDERIFSLTVLCETLNHTVGFSHASLTFQSIFGVFLGSQRVWLRWSVGECLIFLKCMMKSHHINKLVGVLHRNYCSQCFIWNSGIKIAHQNALILICIILCKVTELKINGEDTASCSSMCVLNLSEGNSNS